MGKRARTGRFRFRLALLIPVLLVAAAAASTLVGRIPFVAGAAPGPRTFQGPLPPCRADDVPALHADPSDWARTLLDPMFTFGRRDAPPDLVSTSAAGIRGGGEIRELVIDDLAAMTRAARDDGVRLRVRSAFRSYDDQARTFSSLEQTYGREWTEQSAARPGHSEHQLGTTLDLDGGNDWLAEHAWEHGFIVSYPPDRSPIATCYKPEPWHVRYVGRAEARLVMDAGLSLREWLWLHGTSQADPRIFGSSTTELRPQAC